jgi:hypothetical protein
MKKKNDEGCGHRSESPSISRHLAENSTVNVENSRSRHTIFGRRPPPAETNSASLEFSMSCPNANRELKLLVIMRRVFRLFYALDGILMMQQNNIQKLYPFRLRRAIQLSQLAMGAFNSRTSRRTIWSKPSSFISCREQAYIS